MAEDFNNTQEAKAGESVQDQSLQQLEASLGYMQKTTKSFFGLERFKGSGCSSQNPQGSPQMSAALVPGDPMSSSGLCGHQGQTFKPIHATKRTIHIKN